MGELASPSQLRMAFVRWALVTVPLVVLLGIASRQLSGSAAGNLWFDALQKPDLMPPGWAFGVIWTVLYVLMGLSVAMIIGARGARGRGMALAFFAAQFALNLAWSPIFFAAHKVVAGFAVIVVLFVLAAITSALFARIRSIAGLLLLPYLLWLIYAGFLNFEIMQLNPDAETLVPGRSATQITL
jgi:Tryptophan-rich sensory protein (mitochondrial benzodiazepine receptor homolog)